MIEELLRTNQVFSGGAVLMVLAAVAASLRNVPGRIWIWFKCRFIVEVDIPDRDEAFSWLNEWLATHPYSQRRARRLTVKTDGPRIIFSPAPGYHYFFYRGHLVILHRDRKDGQEGTKMVAIRETFRLTVCTRNRTLVRQLIEDARDLAVPPGDDRLTVFAVRYSEWSSELKRRPRPVESVVLRQGQMEQLIADVGQFLSRESWYAERGVPYRRGYLLSGPPGSGKSSAVLAIASHFKLNIYILNLSANGLNDGELRNLLADVPPSAIVLVEDIDCVFERRQSAEDKDSKVTFSGLLNAIDGVAAAEGHILFMTTNHPESLDPALIRPGRCDLKIEIRQPDSSQVSRLFMRFFPIALPSDVQRFVDQIDPAQTSMAALQGLLLKYGDDAESAIHYAAEAHEAPSC